jgi:hypothetical protein
MYVGFMFFVDMMPRPHVAGKVYGRGSNTIIIENAAWLSVITLSYEEMAE